MDNLLFGIYKFFNKRRFPNLLIIGVQKAGTTTLFDMLNGLPGFCGSDEKETGFFIRNKYYNQGPEWYLKKYQRCNHADIKYEATPAYIYHPDALKRIYEFSNNMKFIVVLREPVARCYSAWNMFRRFNESGANNVFERFTQHANPPEREAIRKLLFAENYPPFKEAVIEDIERYLAKSTEIEPSFVRRGVYCDQIARYVSYFKRSDFLFLEQGELNFPNIVLKKISGFLCMNIDVSLVKTPTALNVGAYPSQDADTEETILLLREFYRPHNEKLFNQIGIRYDWNEGTGLQ